MSAGQTPDNPDRWPGYPGRLDPVGRAVGLAGRTPRCGRPRAAAVRAGAGRARPAGGPGRGPGRAPGPGGAGGPHATEEPAPRRSQPRDRGVAGGRPAHPAGHAEPGPADQEAGLPVVRRAHRRSVPAATLGRRRKARPAPPVRLAAHRPGDLAGPAVGDRGRMRGLDPGRPARRAAGARRARRDRALRLVAGPRAGHRRRGLRAVGGPVADARLRLFRPVHARADPAGRTHPAGPSPGPDPHRGPRIPGRPRSAGSSGTCTTGRRPGWWPWA